MDDQLFERRLAAIVAADVVGYSRLMGLDETGTLTRLKTLRQTLIEPMIARYHGRIVKLMGDGVLLEFPSVVDALACSVQIQREMPSHNEGLPLDQHIQFRIGINLGDIIVEDDDIYGDGVNIAARLEPLAEPRGICLSQAARDALGSKLPLDYEDMGAHSLKNIAEPVRAYRLKVPSDAIMPEGSSAGHGYQVNRLNSVLKKIVRRKWTVVAVIFVLVSIGSAVLWWLPDIERADLDNMAYALPDKPSVAVLSFDNLSADKEQEYFSDGITEDIITDLSKISGLFVVARNSTFSYKGQPVMVRQVAEELGVRYILEGSVRRTEDEIRVTARLIDALRGTHVWAERYDNELKDIFSVQSQVAQQVARALAVTMNANENERLFQKYTANIDAYDVFLKARRIVDVPSRANIEHAEKLFYQVIELDPNFAGGYAGLSFNYSVKVRFQYSTSPSSDLSLAFDLAKKAVEVDREFAWAHIALGGAYLANGDVNAAVDSVRQALTLEPNGYEANLFMGFYLQFAGDSALAVEHLQLARRLSPIATGRNTSFLAYAHFMNRDYTEAVRLFTERIRNFSGSSANVRAFLAAGYMLLDRPEEATAAVEKLMELHPGFNLSQWMFLRSWTTEENRTRVYNAAKKAGVPEYPVSK